MKPNVTEYRVPVRSVAPQAIALARGLAWLYGKAISGDNGTIRYGYPGLSTDRTRFSGYAFPPQAFVGYDAGKVAAGAARPDPASFPGESISPTETAMQRAMHAVTFGITE